MLSKAYLVTAALLAIVSTFPALAATHVVHVTNISDEKIIGVKVMGQNKGEVVGFRSTDTKEFDVQIDLPEGGVCNPIVRFSMSSHRKIEGRVSVCQNPAISIGFPWDY